jgi:hypothetical protein
LQPDKTADFPEDELDPWSPRRRDAVTDGFRTALYGALKSGQQLGLFIKCGCETYPGQHDSKNAKRMNLGVMP